jgi:phage terminase small subunit
MPESARRPPIHLGPAGKRVWRDVIAAFALEPQDPCRLEIAARQADIAEEARRRVAADGAYLMNKIGQVYPHPGLAVENRAQTLCLKALRELGLDAATAGDLARPPALTGRAHLRRA